MIQPIVTGLSSMDMPHVRTQVARFLANTIHANGRRALIERGLVVNGRLIPEARERFERGI